MIYRQFKGLNVSSLGFGTMRLPTIDGVYANIDEEATAEMFDYAIKKGVNYFDTAWGYHDGQSEIVVGKVLSKYPRSSYFLASKFPGYSLDNMGKVEEIFEKQLKKCCVDYFDFYLFHNVCEMNIEAYLDDKKYGTYSYLKKQKENGRIKHLGLSVHGSYDTLRKFLDAYGDVIEFCQIQLNYLDYDFQNAKDKLTLLKERDIPVWVMEPLRGGKLVNLSQEDKDELNRLRPSEGVPAWAFRYLQSIPEVTVTLSGMSNFEQVKDNISTFEKFDPLKKSELAVLKTISDKMIKKSSLPCTSCRYCTTYCPKGIDIPTIISLYNEHCFTEGGFIAPMAISAIPEDKRPSACIGCRSCERVCPQNIGISEMMKDFTKKINK